MEKNINKAEEIEINEEAVVEELTEETLDNVDGGVAGWLIVGGVVIGCACVGAFAVGVYNGYQEAARN